jgi:hypothetical protein
MDIKVTNCDTGHPIHGAIVTDMWGGSYMTDSSGFVVIAPGAETMYFGTIVTVSGSNYIHADLTLTSLGENDVCLKPVGGTGGGGIY